MNTRTAKYLHTALVACVVAAGNFIAAALALGLSSVNSWTAIRSLVLGAVVAGLSRAFGAWIAKYQADQAADDAASPGGH